MSLTLATLIPGLLMLLFGAALLSGRATVPALLKAFPRSNAAALVLFGGGAIWFLYKVWHLPEADFGQYRTILAIAFGAIAVLSFKYVPDFLAVRGLSVLILLSASPLLDAGFMDWTYGEIWDGGRIYLYKVVVYLAIIIAIYLGASPYRLRDFFEWLFRTPGRSRMLGGIFAGYGLLLSIVAFTY